MRSKALEYLGCPECKSELETGNIRTWKGDIRSNKFSRLISFRKQKSANCFMENLVILK